MTTDGRQDRAQLYELTVAGPLGAVLRAALQPYDGCRTEPCTIMRTGASEERDLVDLVQHLDSLGLRVEGVFKISD